MTNVYFAVFIEHNMILKLAPQKYPCTTMLRTQKRNLCHVLDTRYQNGNAAAAAFFLSRIFATRKANKKCTFYANSRSHGPKC